MKVDLITKTDAITVLRVFFPSENWHTWIDDHFDVSHAAGMEFLLKEDLIDFVVINPQPLIEPAHARAFCNGLIAGIEAEANRHFYVEADQVLEALGSNLERDLATDANQIDMMEAA